MKFESNLDFINNSYNNEIETLNNEYSTNTGFIKLDDNINKIKPRLYVLVAGSSIGKTTFCIQMMDNIAKQRPVIYISLETNKIDIINKSLNRIIYNDSELRNKDISNDNIYFPIYDNVRNKAIEIYKTYSNNIYIIDDIKNTNLTNIKEYIDEFIKEKKIKPVLFIDYIQIIDEKGTTDKNKVDNIISKIKNIQVEYNIPVIAISSINRMNYNKTITFSAIKETGNIEYSADYILGLEYSVINDDIKFNKYPDETKDALISNEIDKIPRFITLKAIKARYGKLFNIKYRYYSKYDYFEEC